MTPNDILSNRTKANQLYQAEAYEEAMTLYSKLAENNPYDSGLKLRFADCAARAGQVEQAIASMIDALEIGCTFPWFVRYEIARHYAKLGDKTASLDWLENALTNRWENRPGIMQDEAFTELQTDPRFLRLAGTLTDTDIDRDAGWRFDLDHLVAEAQRLHIDPERPAFSDQFIAMADSLRQRIPTLSDEAIIVALQRMVAQLGDGHSLVYPFRPTDKARFAKLPIDFYYFSDGLFIIDGSDEAKQYIGSQVLQFGAKKTEEIVAEIKDFISADNAMNIKWMMPIYLKQPAFLQALAATDNTTSVTLTLRDQQNNTRDIVLNSNHEPIEISDVFRKLLPSQLHEKPPLYLQNVRTHYWMQALSDLNAIYPAFAQLWSS